MHVGKTLERCSSVTRKCYNNSFSHVSVALTLWQCCCCLCQAVNIFQGHFPVKTLINMRVNHMQFFVFILVGFSRVLPCK